VPILADVERDIVVVDGVMHAPLPFGVAIAKVAAGDEAAVAYVHEAVRHGDVEFHAILRLVAPLVLVGPPDAGAFALAGRSDPGLACFIVVEAEAAEAPLRHRAAVVRDGDLGGLALLEHTRQSDEERALFAGVGEGFALEGDAVEREFGR
jgi:hypothetical protein